MMMLVVAVRVVDWWVLVCRVCRVDWNRVKYWSLGLRFARAVGLAGSGRFRALF